MLPSGPLRSLPALCPAVKTTIKPRQKNKTKNIYNIFLQGSKSANRIALFLSLSPPVSRCSYGKQSQIFPQVNQPPLLLRLDDRKCRPAVSKWVERSISRGGTLLATGAPHTAPAFARGQEVTRSRGARVTSTAAALVALLRSRDQQIFFFLATDNRRRRHHRHSPELSSSEGLKSSALYKSWMLCRREFSVLAPS